MRLTVLERLLLAATLPQEGGMIELRVAQEAGGVIQLTGEEIGKWNVRDVEGGRVEWDPTADTEADVDLSTAACGLIKKALVGMDTQKTLTPNHLTLYAKFVETPSEPED